jgi:hypothetical protein
MSVATMRKEMTTDSSEVDFFGAHIKVRSAKLAALLNSAVTDDVVVVGKRALDLVSPDERDQDLNIALDAGRPDDSLDDPEHIDGAFDKLIIDG